ncbi:hypothetical protein [Paenibacillus dendritiformis]|nr:hypothetical protein [Paenibacillus dendritiformis]
MDKNKPMELRQIVKPWLEKLHSSLTATGDTTSRCRQLPGIRSRCRQAI